jgi:hypothetical protein
MIRGILFVETLGVDCPKSFSLVAEVGVGVEGGEDIGEDCQPEVLSEQAMSFEEASELGEDREDHILPGELVDGEAVWRVGYMLRPVTARAFCWLLCSFYWYSL